MLKYLLAFFVLIFFKSPLLAFIVFVVLVLIERTQKLGSGAINPLSSPLRRKVFLKTTFLLMGKLAKADGKVSVEEIEHSERIFNALGLTAETREQAIVFFKQGMSSDFDLSVSMDEFVRACGRTRNLSLALLEYLVSLALADGHLHEQEKQVLLEVAGRLGFSREAFEKLLSMIQSQHYFADEKVASKDALQEAYKALGVSEDCSNQDLKRAYRKLMSQHHPDKLMGQGLPETMINVATEKAKEIQKAYDLIKGERSKN